MIRVSRLVSRTGVAALLAALLVLGGCSSGNLKDSAVAKARAAGQFDTVVEAYKSGQFLLDGAVLSSLDLGAHFAYLKDQGELPKTVLLVRSEESKVRKEHLQYMARMALDYGFTVYYGDDGELARIKPDEDNARALEETEEQRKPDNRELESHSAAHNGRPGLGY